VKQDYGMRIYDQRVARFLSVDPLTTSYPWFTPYQFAGNMVIWAVDLDGLEPKPFCNTVDKNMGYAIFVTVDEAYAKELTASIAKQGIHVGWNIIQKDPNQLWLYLAEHQSFQGFKIDNPNVGCQSMGVTCLVPPATSQLPQVQPNLTFDNIKTPTFNVAPIPPNAKKDDEKNPPGTGNKAIFKPKIIGKIIFEGSSNRVLSGLDQLASVVDNLNNFKNSTVVIIGNASSDSHVEGQIYGKDDNDIYGQPLSSENSFMYNDITKKVEFAWIGRLMDRRGEKIRQELINKGIDPSRISMKRGTYFDSGEKDRSVEFQFKKN
jgi:outer membrane protein OmpA-like peptidoglycan-associated protein